MSYGSSLFAVKRMSVLFATCYVVGHVQYYYKIIERVIFSNSLYEHIDLKYGYCAVLSHTVLKRVHHSNQNIELK